MIFSRSVLKAGLVNYLEVPVQGLHHLFDVVGAPVHKLVCQKPLALDLDAQIVLIGLLHVQEVILRLIVSLSQVIQLLFSLYELLMDVSPQSIVGHG